MKHQLKCDTTISSNFFSGVFFLNLSYFTAVHKISGKGFNT